MNSKPIIYVLLFQLLCCHTLSAQFHINNGNFENWNGVSLLNVKEMAPSPDYFRKSIKLLHAYSSDEQFIAHFPIQGSDGVGYLGISCDCGGSEAVALALRQTLKKEQSYIVSFDVYMPQIYSAVVPDYYTYALVDKLPQKQKEHGFRELVATQRVYSTLNPDKKWINLRDTFVANGTEKYYILYNPTPNTCDKKHYLLYDRLNIVEMGKEELAVYFDLASAEVGPEGQTALSEIIALLQSNEVERIDLVGFADGKGRSKPNLNLSKQRCEAVETIIQAAMPNIAITKSFKGDSLAQNNNEDQYLRKVLIKPIFVVEKAVPKVPKAIIDSLKLLYDADQTVRQHPKPYTDDIKKMISEHDALVTKFLVKLFETYHYIGLSKTGGAYMDAMAILLMHQPMDLLKKYMSKVKEASNEAECSRYLFAYLLDKAKLDENEKQVFGTQYFYNEDGTIALYPIIDEKNVDTRRREIGLPPLKAYKASIGME